MRSKFTFEELTKLAETLNVDYESHTLTRICILSNLTLDSFFNSLTLSEREELVELCLTVYRDYDYATPYGVSIALFDYLTDNVKVPSRQEFQDYYLWESKYT